MSSPIARIPSGQAGHSANTGALSPLAYDAEGWTLPKRRQAPPSAPSPAELANQKKIATLLRRSGWDTEEWVHCYDRDGRTFVPDLVVLHPDRLAEPGVIEVKAEIRDLRAFIDAAKQAIDYTGAKVLATGARIRWAAVYPFEPDAETADAMWGALAMAGVAFKCGAFLDGDVARSIGLISRGRPDKLCLFYKREQRVWCDAYGVTTDTANMLTGKRRIGGQRL